MTEIIIALIEQLNSSVFVLILIFVLFCYCLFIFAKWLGKSEEKESHTTHTLNKLEARIDILPELKGKIELIYNNTLADNKRMTASRSPIALTDVGKKVAEKLKAKDIIDRIYTDIKKNMETNHANISNKNAYDIQEIIFTYFSDNIEAHLKGEELNSFKTEAYNRGLIVGDLYRILAVIFRDRLLNELKKPVSDIDKHDPINKNTKESKNPPIELSKRESKN